VEKTFDIFVNRLYKHTVSKLVINLMMLEPSIAHVYRDKQLQVWRMYRNLQRHNVI